MDDTPEEESKAVYFFGRDVSQIPCFRSTFLNGTGTGAGVGLIHFMFTSNVRKSLIVAYGTFFVSSMSYWFYCTYNYSKTRFELLRMQTIIQEKMLKEGTAEDFSLSGNEEPLTSSRSDEMSS